MTLFQSAMYFIVSFSASVVGAICGIGGGVIIKPLLDFFGWAGVSTISFLSGCTVLSMSSYSVLKSLLAGEKRVDLHTGTFLALGAAAGGTFGKQLFSYVKALFPDPDTVGAVQALCLFIVTFGTLVYTLRKDHIRTHRTQNPAVCIAIGFFLGMMSSFLGIGGGPINLVVLYYFFSMDTKTAAANSLYIILFSQAASLIVTLATRTVPEFSWTALILMVAGGIGGGMAGRVINRRIDNRTVEKLFCVLMVIIMVICAYNTWKYH